MGGGGLDPQDHRAEALIEHRNVRVLEVSALIAEDG